MSTRKAIRELQPCTIAKGKRTVGVDSAVDVLLLPTAAGRLLSRSELHFAKTCCRAVKLSGFQNSSKGGDKTDFEVGNDLIMGRRDELGVAVVDNSV